jgi:elongation factor P
MKINGNQIRPGNLIEHNGRLWIATKIQHTQPGKGGAYAQVELKDIRSGTKLNERFRSSESVERVRLDDVYYQFLFNEDDQFTFMHPETFEQLTLSREEVSEGTAVYLQDGMTVKISFHEESVISVQAPDTVVMTIVEADAVVKGQTASASYKPGILENGVRILIPPHIEAGTRVVVNTEEGTYVERAKD